MSDTLTHLKTRRTIPATALGLPAPTPDQIAEMIAIAARVPDHGKLTPWRFIVYEGAARDAVGAELARLWALRDPAAGEDRLEQERQRFARAPLVIGVISRAAEHVKIPVIEQEWSVGAAAMNLVHAAHALGFAAQWVTQWMAYDAEASRLLGARDGEHFAGFIHIGTPKEAPVERPRPAVSDLVSYWGR